MNVFTSEVVTGLKYFTPSKPWATVDVDTHATVPIRIGYSIEDSKLGPDISRGSRYGWPTLSKGLVVRTANAIPVHVTIREWDSKNEAPSDIIRPVIGTTAKGRRTPTILTVGDAPVVVDEPSTGEFACQVQIDPKANGYARIASNGTKGLWVYPGAPPIMIPNWNGTLFAEAFGEAGESFEIVVLKHENAYTWDY